MKKETKTVYGDIFSFLIAIACVTWFIWGVNNLDNQAKNVMVKTKYFEVINKDYKDTAKAPFSSDYNFVIYIKRFDINKEYIDCQFAYNYIEVTKWEYDNVDVGVTYNESYIDIYTCGF